MKTLCYHLHRGLLLELLVQLQKMLCLLILWFMWGPCNGTKPTSIYGAPHITPPLKGEMAQSHMHRERRCKGQLWVSVASFRRKSFADEQFAKDVCPCVWMWCCLRSQIVCLISHFFGELNSTGPSGSSLLHCPPKNMEISDSQGTELCCMENRKCIKYACPDYNVKIDSPLPPSYVYEALTMPPTTSKERSGGRSHYVSSVTDSPSFCYRSKHNSNVDQKWVTTIKLKKIQGLQHFSYNHFLLKLITNINEKMVM